jgi:hypothetical protein
MNDQERIDAERVQLESRVQVLETANAEAEAGWHEAQQNYKQCEQDCLQLCDTRDELTDRAKAAEQKLAAANELLRRCNGQIMTADPHGRQLAHDIRDHLANQPAAPPPHRGHARHARSNGIRFDQPGFNTPTTPIRTEAEQAVLPTFEQAWARKRDEGYQYGGDALENVRFGYEIAAELARWGLK